LFALYCLAYAFGFFYLALLCLVLRATGGLMHDAGPLQFGCLQMAQTPFECFTSTNAAFAAMPAYSVML
jgi:hypothetical protein